MRTLEAILWVLIGFFLTPAFFFLALGFLYVSPDMLLHFWKFFVCYYLFYYTFEVQS